MDVGVVHPCADRLRSAFDAELTTVPRFRTFQERVAQGTAGSLRYCRDFVGDSSFLLIDSGVVGLDLDLQEAERFHTDQGAGITVLVQPADSGQSRDQVIESRDGRVESISVPYAPEPGRAVLSSLGVYFINPRVFEMIPQHGHFDLKEQLIPLLHRLGVPVFAYSVTGRARRFTTLTEYFDTNRDLLLDNFPGPVQQRRSAYDEVAQGVWVARSATVSPKARLIGPVVVGENCRVEAGASVVGPVSIGDGCSVMSGASISDSILWSGVRVSAGARVDRSILCTRSVVPPGRKLSAGVVLESGDPGGTPRLTPDTAPSSFTRFVSDNGRLTSASRGALARACYRVCKRLFDIVGSSLGLLLALPLLAVAAIAIKADSPGPVLFRQKRCGRGGRPFTMLKFRSMVQDAPQRQRELMSRNEVDGPMFKMTHDPRVTRVGRVLRKTCIDELPQLVNVLKGELSFVGPRPLTMDEMRFAPAWRDMRLSVKPGMTGPWQVYGHTDLGFHEWIRHDTDYARSRSMGRDMYILLQTARLVARAFFT